MSLSGQNLVLYVDAVDLMKDLHVGVSYLQWFFICADTSSLMDVAIDGEHEIIAFDVLPKEVESESG